MPLRQAKPPRRWPALAWALAQAAAAAIALIQLCGGGLLLAAARRELRWVATALATATLAVGLATVVALSWGLGADWLRGPEALVAAGLALSLVAGLAAASVARGRLGLYELELAWACNLAGLYGLLSRPWPAFLSAHVAPPWAPAAGQQVFGPMWAPLLGLFVGAGLLLSLFGASFALALGFGAEGGRRGRPTRALEGLLISRSLRGQDRHELSATARVATVGVMLGVAALIVVTAVMSGYQSDIEGRILRTNAHLVLQKYGGDFTETAHLLPVLEQIEGVAAAAPFAFNEAILTAHSQSHSVLLKGIAATKSPVTDLASQLCSFVDGQGRNARCVRDEAASPSPKPVPSMAEGPPGIFVGLSLFQALDVPLGAVVQLLTPAALGHGSRVPRRERFVLEGVFQAGMHEFDSHLVYVAMPAAQQLLGLGRAVSGIEMRLDEPRQVAVISERVLAAAGHYPYRTIDWRALNGSIFMALSLQKIVMFLLLSFIVVVASFNIASTLMMAAIRRSAQIAVLKSMGALDSTILRLFVCEGLAIAGLGCGLGCALGLGVAHGLARLDLGIAADVYMVGRLTVRLDGREVAATLGLAFAICQVASLAPALRAAARSPARLFDETG